MKDFKDEPDASIEYLSLDDSLIDESLDDSLSDDDRNYKPGNQPEKSAATRALVFITILLLGIIVVLNVHLQKQHNSTESFSAQETPVGRWIDGTTLYRICISSHNSDPVELKIADCREIVECSCTVRGSAEWSGGFYISVDNDSIVITPQLGAALFKTDKMNYVVYYVK